MKKEQRALIKLEQARVAHVAQALKGVDLDDPEAVAVAALDAADSFFLNGWPFGCDLNERPETLSSYAYEAIEQIDAGMFSGDCYHPRANHVFLAAHVQRWGKELRKWRQNDTHETVRPDVKKDETAQRLAMATTFKVAEDVYVESRGNDTWCVRILGSVLNADGEREYEPMPSGRTPEFIARTRFTMDEAFKLAHAYRPQNHT